MRLPHHRVSVLLMLVFAFLPAALVTVAEHDRND